MNLNPTQAQRQELETALLGAYDYNDMRRMMTLWLGLRMEDEVNVQQGFKYIVTDLVSVALQGGWLFDLVLSARRYRDGNWMLERVANNLNVTEPPPPPVAGLPRETSLEKIVNERSPFQNYAEFLDRFQRLGARICRIEIPEGVAAGTGWLVGPDLLMTAYHVIESVEKNHIPAAEVGCRFDYVAEPLPGTALAGTLHRFATDWLIDHTRYSQADLVAQGGEPGPDELDYALLRLADAVGEEALPAGGTRDWFEVSENPPVVRTDDIMLVVQHPQGRTLELGFGQVIAYNDTGNRLRYDVNTERGSSGSPCFSLALEPFGIHHAAGPTNALTYNQCVPLRPVLRRMREQNIPAFWT